jgi:hypothetical protein
MAKEWSISSNGFSYNTTVTFSLIDVITNCGYRDDASCCVCIINIIITMVTTISDYYGNHNSWLHIQLTATAVKQTVWDSILLYASWWWSYDRNMCSNNIGGGEEELLRWRTTIALLILN